MFFGKREETIPYPPGPYVLTPSGSFDGNDGRWSSFNINIGDDGTNKSNGQNFRVLISTSSGVTLVPGQAQWCDDTDCAKSRGIGVYNGQQSLGLQESSTWQDAGIYSIPLPDWWTDTLAIDSSNTTAGGIWGLDNVGLGLSSPESPILQGQYVVKYLIQNFFMGSFGLAAGSSGPQGAVKPNFLDSLYNSGVMIASRSYGYSAGAYHRNNNGVTGSLVLGGYDESRFTKPGISISMPNKSNNTLVVGVQSILYKPDQNIEPNVESLTQSGGFSATIDSTLPYLILPDDVCNEFASRFGLILDESSQLFTVNASAHRLNQNQNASVSFKIGAGPGDSASYTSIDLPYSAFDQQANYPLPVADGTQYFPIKRTDKGIYVLGRTFLQEAYIIVDYERSNFTVAPAYYADPMPAQTLVSIYNTTYTRPPSPDSGSKGGLPAGAIAGIVVGIVLAFVIAGVAAFLLWRKRRAAKKSEEETEKPSEIDTTSAGAEIKYRRVSELTGSEAPQSPKDSAAGYYNVDHKSIPPISEMSPESTPAELYSPPPDGRDTFDYFSTGRMRRRGATRDRDSSGNNTPRTPIAELPGDDAVRALPGKQDPVPKPQHSRSPSDNSLSTNIDEVLAKKRAKAGADGAEQSVEPGAPATREEIARATTEAQQEGAEHAAQSVLERRPSHARGLSDTTVQSDSTAVSQPTPEEIERWARNVDDGPIRPMSP
ncbi:acid protease [Decorospora gaudefroyi]|uniref:Acid protease n=1 Tax=Decorospora gaudefroyi TaxID=184978 RepID=A0A6A5K5N5_9PLEO|nr:acid protease [Decorospora gaudefroyi]